MGRYAGKPSSAGISSIRPESSRSASAHLEVESAKSRNVDDFKAMVDQAMSQSMAEELAKFIVFLRKRSELNPSDTRLIYMISDFLKVEFDVASKAVNDALGISE